MKYEALKNIIAANRELIKSGSKDYIVNPICYYLVMEYISQESGFDFVEIATDFENMDTNILNAKVDNFIFSERKDYEPDLDKSDLVNYRLQKMKEIRRSEEGQLIESKCHNDHKLNESFLRGTR